LHGSAERCGKGETMKSKERRTAAKRLRKSVNHPTATGQRRVKRLARKAKRLRGR
jgi:hypothetical protein